MSVFQSEDPGDWEPIFRRLGRHVPQRQRAQYQADLLALSAAVRDGDQLAVRKPFGALPALFETMLDAGQVTALELI